MDKNRSLRVIRRLCEMIKVFRFLKTAMNKDKKKGEIKGLLGVL